MLEQLRRTPAQLHQFLEQHGMLDLVHTEADPPATFTGLKHAMDAYYHRGLWALVEGGINEFRVGLSAAPGPGTTP